MIVDAEIADFTFVTPPRLVMGYGAATDSRLAQETARLGVRPLIVCGRSLRTNGTLATILDNLTQAGLQPTTHEGVPPEPSVADLQTAMDAARDTKADCVLAIGGGSALDVAKGAAALAPTQRTARDFFTGVAYVPDTGLPILAVPTTAGTGSEATWVSVLTDKEANGPYPRKASIRGQALLPTVALLDAQLTLTCSPHVTAYSGMDALVQAIEAYTSVGANSLTRALACEAASLIATCLSHAYQDPNHRPSRENMILGSYMAGMALNTARLGLVHGLAHPIGAITGAAHGLICALLMPAVLDFNRPVAEGHYEILMERAFYDEDKDEHGFDGLHDNITRLLEQMHIPRCLSEIGVRPEHLDYIAAESMKSGSTKANPRPVTENDARAVTASCL